MKKLFLMPMLIVFITTGCKKEPVINPAPIPSILPTLPLPPPPPPITPTNTAPQVSVGADFRIIWPMDSCVLKGSATDAESNIEKYSWKKISGPLSSLIVNPDTLETNVTNLQKGIYKFQFSATDKGSLTGISTITIGVYEIPAVGANEHIIKDQSWECPMGCWMKIEKFNSIVPAGNPFRLFIKRKNSGNWIEALPDQAWILGDEFSYGLNNNTLLLWVYSSEDETVNSDIKITY